MSSVVQPVTFDMVRRRATGRGQGRHSGLRMVLVTRDSVRLLGDEGDSWHLLPSRAQPADDDARPRQHRPRWSAGRVRLVARREGGVDRDRVQGDGEVHGQDRAQAGCLAPPSRAPRPDPRWLRCRSRSSCVAVTVLPHPTPEHRERVWEAAPAPSSSVMTVDAIESDIVKVPRLRSPMTQRPARRRCDRDLAICDATTGDSARIDQRHPLLVPLTPVRREAFFIRQPLHGADDPYDKLRLPPLRYIGRLGSINSTSRRPFPRPSRAASRSK